MAEQWYYAKGGQRSGPSTEAQLQQLAACGQLQPTDLVWKKGMAEVTQASQIFPPPPPVPTQTAQIGSKAKEIEQWYYAQQGQRKGPVSKEQIRKLMSSGQLQASDLVWRKGMAQWTQTSRVFPPPPPDPNGPPPVPTQAAQIGSKAKEVNAQPGIPNSMTARSRDLTPYIVSQYQEKPIFIRLGLVFGVSGCVVLLVVLPILWYSGDRERREAVEAAEKTGRMAQMGMNKNTDITDRIAKTPSMQGTPNAQRKTVGSTEQPIATPSTDDLPEQVLKQSPWPDLPLAKLASQSFQFPLQDMTDGRSNIQFSPKGILFLITTEPGVRLWQRLTGEEKLRSLRLQLLLPASPFSPDERILPALTANY